jgi:hypothetical protein
VPVCVPANVYNQSWENPPRGGKMEAFRNMAEKTIRDIATNVRSGNPNTEYMVFDVFDKFDPGTTDPRDVVTFLTVSPDKFKCPANSFSYALPINP